MSIIIFQTGHELSIVLGNESTSALARVRFASTIEWVKPVWKIVYIIWTTSCIRMTIPWTNFGNLAANKKKKLTQKSKKMFPTTQKSHVSPFGSNSQGCIYLLKIIAAITSVPIQFPRVGIFGSIFRNHGNKCVKLCFYWSIFNKWQVNGIVILIIILICIFFPRSSFLYLRR
jgi:hypothetical protein